MLNFAQLGYFIKHMVARQRKKSQGSGIYREVAIIWTNGKEGLSFAEKSAGPMQKIPPTMLNFYQLHT